MRRILVGMLVLAVTGFHAVALPFNAAAGLYYEYLQRGGTNDYDSAKALWKLTQIEYRAEANHDLWPCGVPVVIAEWRGPGEKPDIEAIRTNWDTPEMQQWATAFREAQRNDPDKKLSPHERAALLVLLQWHNNLCVEVGRPDLQRTPRDYYSAITNTVRTISK